MVDYNSKESIAAQLGSYSSFYSIMRLRNERGGYKYDGTKSEDYGKLTPFTVLGRYRSDQFGQCWRLNRRIFTDTDRATMSQVMTDEEFQTFFNKHVKPRITEALFSTHEGWVGMAPTFSLPPPHLVCSRCSKNWELDTCHDIDAEGDFEKFDLASFLGKSLREVERELQSRTDAERHLNGSLTIQNPQWVGRDAKEPRTKSEQLGWRRKESKENPITWDYVIQARDNTSLVRYRFYHGECFRQLQNERSREEEAEAANINGMKQMLEESGFEDVCITRAPLPERLRKWIATDLDENESIDEITEAFVYYRVNTQQGSFGVGYAAYPMLDLEGSGISLRDLEPSLTEEPPPDFPPITGFSGEPEQLLRLWQLMVKKQTNKTKKKVPKKTKKGGE